MNAKEISDATLPAVTPADDDLMILYDVSEGTTGKTPISGIAPKVAENIDIATLPAVTPAANDVLMIRDTSAGTTGKATITDIVQKGVDGLPLYQPLLLRDKYDSAGVEGGEIVFQNAEKSDMVNVIVDVYKNTFRFFTKINNDLKMFTLDFENKRAYWN